MPETDGTVAVAGGIKRNLSYPKLNLEDLNSMQMQMTEMWRNRLFKV